MRKNILFFAVLLNVVHLSAQQPKPQQNQKPAKKYQSLLWEITGNGLKKPSYLFGTMHVSDKLAFHLGDSFYHALKAVQVVALETNPEHWQDHFSKSSLYRNRDNNDRRYQGQWRPNDRMTLGSFSIDHSEQAIKAALAVEPSMVNGLLYRTYGTKLDDFEEDQYLDLYIFQAGKKLGKRLTEVENFEESEKLVKEAYRDMIRDKNKKRRSYDFEDRYTNPKKVEDAYRNGDLDMMDSLQALTVSSEAFEEKFLYKRNEIQAKSIDTILKKATLFVAVGAAHLPGRRGVIEMLRKMGYTLRPVKMDDRNSTQKETIDRMRYATHFVSQAADDQVYQVSIPGTKFYQFTDWNGMDVVQYADMVNGAYYMVTRVKTNSLFRGQSLEMTNKKIDSFLYENVPGKILKKNPVTRNGYKGWEILNRTRRGDHQRYQVFVTPFEVLLFKMSGNGDYIAHGTEAAQFFGSIKIKEYKPHEWTSFQPATGGFAVQLPHAPSLLKEQNFGADRLEFGAFDRNGNSYLVIQSNLHNYSFAEEDSFELNLMNDSYAHSSFIDEQLSKKFSNTNGYPSLDARYLHKDGSFSSVKFIIRGPLYYVVAVRHLMEEENANRFLSSFKVTPFIYPEVKPWTDTAMRFTVLSPVFRDTAKKEEEDDEDDYRNIFRLAFADEDPLEEERFRSAVIGNDTLGEKIYVTYSAPSKYGYWKDTVKFWKRLGDFRDSDSSFIYRMDNRTVLANGTRVRELHLTDTASSKLILSKSFYKEGYIFSLTALTDTLSPRSSFLQNFFSTFTPADTLKGKSLFTRKTDLFFRDFFSTDSLTARRAFKLMNSISFDSLDVPLLKNAIVQANWKTRDYIDTKKFFINELGMLKDSTITPFLKQLYVSVKDTSDFQNAILNALLQQETKPAFIAFKDMLLQEPPISDDDNDYYYNRSSISYRAFRSSYDVVAPEVGDYSGPWWQLYDTMALTKQIFPELLQLMNVTDYEERIKDLLTTLVDSGFIKAPDYETHFSKLYLDAKQLLKKQVASEERDNMEKLNKKDQQNYLSYFSHGDDDDDEVLDEGNEVLSQYAVLLMPFYEKNPGVAGFFSQLLKTRDRGLLYDVFILMLRNNKAVPDSLFEKYAKLDEYRFQLYGDLKKMNRLDKFPAAYKSQDQMARSILASEIDEPDTLVYLEKLPVVYKNKKGVVHFYKYKAERDDTYWQLACVGMQPENENEIDLENDEFTESGNHKIDETKTLKEQMEKVLKELLYAKRGSATDFYDSRNYSLYKTYLPDIVKSYRYRD